MRLGNSLSTVARPFQSAYPSRFSGNIYIPTASNYSPIKFASSSKPSAKSKGFLETMRGWLKVLLPPAALAAGAMYQNANMLKHMSGLEKNFSKLIAENAPKPLSTAQGLWQNTKDLSLIAVTSLGGFYGIKKLKTILEPISVAVGNINTKLDTLNTTIINELGNISVNRLRPIYNALDEIRTNMRSANNLLQPIAMVVRNQNRTEAAYNATVIDGMFDTAIGI